jgi:hypothetical protein
MTGGRRIVSGLIFLCAFLLPAAAVRAADSGSGGIAATVKLDGRDTRTISVNDPQSLTVSKPLRVEIAVSNGTDRPIIVRSVRLDARVLGLTFVLYTTQVDLTLPPGRQDTRNFSLDTSDLSGQATGLLPARVSLIDPKRHTLASVHFPADVHGSLTSVYGVFGLAIFGLTLLLVGSALFDLARHRLSENRWLRGTRFAAAGVGMGMTLTFTLSALKLVSPDPSKWLVIVVIGGAVGLLVGYLTPTPHRPDPEDDLPPLPRQALAGAHGAHSRREIDDDHREIEDERRRSVLAGFDDDTGEMTRRGDYYPPSR